MKQKQKLVNSLRLFFFKKKSVFCVSYCRDTLQSQAKKHIRYNVVLKVLECGEMLSKCLQIIV